MAEHLKAAEVITTVLTPMNNIDAFSTKFICPHPECGGFTQHSLGQVNSVGLQLGGTSRQAGSLGEKNCSLPFAPLVESLQFGWKEY